MNSNQEAKQVKLVLFLSRTCPHCRKLISEYSELIFDAGIEQVFAEDSNFKNKYKSVYDYFYKNSPELAKYEYITPVLAIFDTDDNVVQVLPGYALVKQQFDNIKEQMYKNE